MNKINENKFKSLDNSQNIGGLDWAIISLSITSRPIAFDYPTRFCLCREVAYLSNENKVYQVGRLYIPANRLKNIWFFLRLAVSRKTFGHFVTKYFQNLFEFSVLESTEPRKGFNILFNPKSEICYSKRVIKIKRKNYIFYVEEELEII